MFYYLMNGDTVLVSSAAREDFPAISESQAKDHGGRLYFLCHQNPAKFRRSFALTDPSLAFLKEEGIHLLARPEHDDYPLPLWLKEKILSGQASLVNTAYPTWQDVSAFRMPKQWTVNIVGLGDVGGTLLTGLRLLGGKVIRKIGIFDTDGDKVKRWDYEGNQIFSPFQDVHYPEIEGIGEAQFFDCDLFVFCVSLGVPPVGQEQQDVRLAQLEGNGRVVNFYARLARERGFKGIFAVVSDPVDLLCKSAWTAGNTDGAGRKDYLGLAPEQIRGYGLGVMNARAVYFARKSPDTIGYLTEGRAYGPHGEGLVIANSMVHYDDRISRYLTDKARKANLDVRSMGYKPYVAPALSSGALSLLATMEGKWHYSATFMGGVYMGAKNRLTPAGTELERLMLPEALMSRLQETYEHLRSYGL